MTLQDLGLYPSASLVASIASGPQANPSSSEPSMYTHVHVDKIFCHLKFLQKSFLQIIILQVSLIMLILWIIFHCSIKIRRKIWVTEFFGIMHVYVHVCMEYLRGKTINFF